ncbi:MAG TPA: SAM-dependent methyltransferase [Flavitalea sp.]|nr:SAM-dependent methyltransferase [Flavitalea sp.]
MEKNRSNLYLIPSFIHADAMDSLPASVLSAVKDCQVFFVENERSARRFLKSIWKEMVIDDYSWITIHKAEAEVTAQLGNYIKQGKNIGIISEAGCPGIADPGQILVEAAHRFGAEVRPIVGPSSILLALMASGLNGQTFMFNGYLPIQNLERINAIKSLEDLSRHRKCTMLLIETPYRNNAMMDSLLKNLKPTTRLSIALNLTSKNQQIMTMTVLDWRRNVPTFQKEPAIFSFLA